MLKDSIKILQAKISEQDIEIVKMLSNGLIVTDIANELKMNKRTAEAKVARLKSQLQCSNTPMLVSFFLRNKLIG